jgi:hypothetical protein
MKRILSTTVGAGSVAAFALVSIAVGSTGGKHSAAAKKSQIAIKERGSAQMTSDKTFKGRFFVVLDGVIEDSGTTVIRGNEGTAKTVGGQPQTPVVGNDNLTTKKGTLSLAFRGVSIAVSVDPAKAPFYNEYGSWKISGGSGIYKGWKGGGRWALVGTPTANNIEWDGVVTH